MALLFDELEAIQFYARKPTCRRHCLTPAQAGVMLSLPVHQIRCAVELELVDAEQYGAGRNTCLLSVEDAERFGRDFVSITHLAAKHGHDDQTVRAALEAGGASGEGTVGHTS